jgi:transposase
MRRREPVGRLESHPPARAPRWRSPPTPRWSRRPAEGGLRPSTNWGCLEEADRCEPGEIGALLRREGLYSSHLTTWRRQREAGALAGLTPRKRGRRAQPVDVQGARVAELEREVERLRQRLLQAETIIEVQKKVSLLLGIDPSPSASAGRP